MPIYEYLCRRCDLEFELLVGVNSSENCCPNCASTDLFKKFSVFGMKTGGRSESSAKSSCAGCSSGNCNGCGC
ncbi:MAG: FmdB family zinc ribbon protein [candidate division Zixibacteria bacterium]